MFNVNGPEILVIAVIFLLLFGPERVPEMAVRLGRLVYQLRQAAEQATGEFTRELELAAGDLDSVKSDFEAVSDLAKKTLGADLGTIGSTLLQSPKPTRASTTDPATAENRTAPTAGAAGDGPPAAWRPPTAEELAADAVSNEAAPAEPPPPTKPKRQRASRPRKSPTLSDPLDPAPDDSATPSADAPS